MAVGDNKYSPVGRHDLGPCVLVRMVQEDIIIHPHLVLLTVIVLPTKQENVCPVFLQAARHISSETMPASLFEVYARSDIVSIEDSHRQNMYNITGPGAGVKVAKRRGVGGSALDTTTISFAFLSCSWKLFSIASRSSSPPCSRALISRRRDAEALLCKQQAFQHHRNYL